MRCTKLLLYVKKTDFIDALHSVECYENMYKIRQSYFVKLSSDFQILAWHKSNCNPLKWKQCIVDFESSKPRRILKNLMGCLWLYTLVFQRHFFVFNNHCFLLLSIILYSSNLKRMLWYHYFSFYGFALVSTCKDFIEILYTAHIFKWSAKMCKFPSSYLANCRSSTLFVWCAFFYIVILYIVNEKEICTEM